LPGIGDRFLSKKPHNRTILKPSEINVLKECECPICSNYGNIGQRIRILDAKRDCRVVHNAWVYQREVDIATEMINQGNYEKYIEKVLKSASFLSLFRYAKSVAKQNKLNHIL
jgi:queuine/archaeosine tRNA-ribosyltransferase